MTHLSHFLFTVFLAIHAKSEETFSCLNERKSSCALCPTVISENEVILNFGLCARDCYVIGEGETRLCVPKAVSCGERRESSCQRCPIVRDNVLDLSKCRGDCEVKQVRINNQDVKFCDSSSEENSNKTQIVHVQKSMESANRDDCLFQNLQFWGGQPAILSQSEEISWESCQQMCKRTQGCIWFNWNHPSCLKCQHTNSCFLFSSKGQVSVPGSGRFSGSANSVFCGFRESHGTQTSVRNTQMKHGQALTSLTVEITLDFPEITKPENTKEIDVIPGNGFYIPIPVWWGMVLSGMGKDSPLPPSRTKAVNVEVCVESRCCEITSTSNEKLPSITFSKDFKNLGNCEQLRKEQYETVTVKAEQINYDDCQIKSIKAQFDDGSLMTAGKQISFWDRSIPESEDITECRTGTPLQWGLLEEMTECFVECF